MTAYDIQGKHALVTGANRGIGKAISKALLNHGVTKLYAAVRDPKSAQGLIDEFGADRVEAVEFDLTKDDLVQKAAQKASDVHIVVNNAGILKTASPTSENTFEALREELDVNMYGLLRTARAFAPVLKQNGGGALAQLNSVVSMKAFKDFATYSASKAASYSITQSLRDELQEQGTAVYSVHPGPIDTDMGDQAGFEEGQASDPSMVGEALVSAFKNGNFHVFPDPMAKDIGGAYESFAKNVVESEVTVG